jgi:O-antigen ligase
MSLTHQDKINGTVLPWLVIAACFAVSMKTAVFSIIIGVFIILWLVSGQWKAKFKRITSNQGAVIAIVLFGLYGIGLTYSEADWSHKLSWWLKYDKLLYIPLIVSIMQTEKHRKYAVNAFILSSILVLIISYSKWLHIIPFDDVGQGYIAFRNRIAQSIFMAFTVYLMLHRALNVKGSYRTIWLVLSVLGSVNILVMVNGRTGQVLLIALLLWFLWEAWGTKSVKWLALSLFGEWLVLTLLGTMLFYQITPNINLSRSSDIKQEIKSHMTSSTRTSAGERIEFYKNSLLIIAKSPLVGSGTGSFENEYRKLAKTQKNSPDRVPNPHNQFLLTTAELGAIGLITFLYFWFTHWRTSYNLEKNQYQITFRGLILTIFIGSFFNSLLLDAGEGRLYCVIAGVLLSAYRKKEDA